MKIPPFRRILRLFFWNPHPDDSASQDRQRHIQLGQRGHVYSELVDDYVPGQENQSTVDETQRDEPRRSHMSDIYNQDLYW